MPIYEYLCQACGHDLEAIQKFSDAPLSDCPKCAKPSLKKQISAAGFQLKGSGWYATDFKGGTKKKDDDGGNKSEAPGDTKSDTKSDTKTESADSKPASCGTGCGCH